MWRRIGEMKTLDLIEKIEHIAYRIWEKNTPYQIQEKMLDMWDNIKDETGTKYEPLCKADEKLTCAVLGSGSFSTGREELFRAKKLREKLGWTPIEYVAVITNKEDSKARDVASEYKLPCIAPYYSVWKKENGITGNTVIFGFQEDKTPSKEALKERFEIRRKYDDYLKNVILEELGEMPSSLSLRGYNSILIEDFFKDKKIQVDNTHPATLIVRENDGKPAYAGWQENAYNKMKRDGHTVFPTSLIRVSPVGSCDDLNDVDSGELFAISPGNPDEYVKTEDYYLLTLKATGLFPFFWGLSEEEKEVSYLTRENKPIKIRQREVIVADKVMSGVNAFGQREDDMEIFLRLLSN